jgi:hypothetical protein
MDVVGTGRVELPTYRLGGGCSIQLSYVPTPAHADDHLDCNREDRLRALPNCGGKGSTPFFARLPGVDRLVCDRIAPLDPALEPFPSDIPPDLHPVEVDLVAGSVHVRDCLL